MRILVTGADGYLGQPLVSRLIDEGHDVRRLDSGLYRDGVLDGGADGSERADTRDLVLSRLDDADAVVHLAELSNDPLGELDEELTIAINHRGSVRLADLAAAAGVERFLYFSSCSVYGATGADVVDEDGPTRPLTAYARCKVAVERDLLGVDRGGLHPIVMRNATVYGPSPALRLDLAINEFVYDAVLAGSVRMRSAGTSWRPFVHSHDIAAAAAALLAAPASQVSREIVNIGSDAATVTVRAAADIVAARTGVAVEVDDDSPDKRDYRVSFAKLERTLPDLQMRDMEAGIAELVDFVQARAATFRSRPKQDFFRLAMLRRQMESGELDATLRRTQG